MIVDDSMIQRGCLQGRPDPSRIGVHQTRRGGPDLPPEERGNCFAACLATILEIPMEEVEHHVAYDDGWQALLDWLMECGWYLHALDHPDWRSWLPGFTIMGVDSAFLKLPEGGGHVVVAYDGVPWWNPNEKDDRHAEELLRAYAGDLYILYPLDPANPVPIGKGVHAGGGE